MSREEQKIGPDSDIPHLEFYRYLTDVLVILET